MAHAQKDGASLPVGMQGGAQDRAHYAGVRHHHKRPQSSFLESRYGGAEQALLPAYQPASGDALTVGLS